MEDLEKTIRNSGLIPIDKTLVEDKILVVDINYILSEFKNQSPDELMEYFKEKYGYNVFLIDSSRQNIQGTKNDNIQPVYFI